MTVTEDQARYDTNHPRVGVRQWRILLLAAAAFPDPIGGEAVRGVLEGAASPAHVRSALSGLLSKKLLRHACSPDCPTPSHVCQYAVTEAGLDAKLGDQGGWHGGGRMKDVLAA